MIIFSKYWLLKDNFFKREENNFFVFSIYDKVKASYRENYLLELEIPRINLKEMVYDIDSIKNQVDYGIEILSSSNLEENVYFFAGHSGRGLNTYFNDLDQLEIGDIIYVKRENIIYKYVIINCYFVVKNGYLEVDSHLKDVLFLITCSLEYLGKQLVIQAKLV